MLVEKCGEIFFFKTQLKCNSGVMVQIFHDFMTISVQQKLCTSGLWMCCESDLYLFVYSFYVKFVFVI